MEEYGLLTHTCFLMYQLNLHHRKAGHLVLRGVSQGTQIVDKHLLLREIFDLSHQARGDHTFLARHVCYK